MFNMIRVIDGYNDSTLQIILNIYKTEKNLVYVTVILDGPFQLCSQILD
jgi:hypothetical protein